MSELNMRKILVVMGVMLLLLVVRAAAAQDVNNPFSIVFDVSCDFDEDGFLESSFEASTFLNPTGTGRDLASQSTFTVISGIAEGTLNGETIFVTEIPERPGRGLRTVVCNATAALIDGDGNELVITITDATFLVTPVGAPTELVWIERGYIDRILKPNLKSITFSARRVSAGQPTAF